ncbi:putative monovalent cation/H+ antiporter subunit A [Indioceanicola profundi]|uniref:putative monovalent cation/H+ antiporter subunit A n=1 Tax=Indioceanicola profundi TaxID=2220096 RepID=UPI000E6AD107|nr:putative monovalent cation/H+ antiporter subunit A [Indioceanicola profundi]
MLTAVLAIFLLAAVAPTVHRFLPHQSHWVLALVPAAVTAWFAMQLPEVGAIGSGHGEQAVIQVIPWIPSLGVELAFRLDGLALMFALLITGIGTFIVIYAGGYLHGHVHQGRFYLFIIAFMASMLGLVLADDVVSLFVFWELTSITSFMLISFNHEDPSSRRSAVQALLVTASGGLALLGGLVLLGQTAGSFRLTEIEASGVDLRQHALYLPILALLLLGAFTKSAQVPFHFWLPNAMDAPTPVSAYLHSATMVKAGVYLVARLNPTMGGTDVWFYTLVGFGTVTALWGGYMALRSVDMKKILAYTTLFALGTLVMLVGLGTPYAFQAFGVFLLAHALYKGALFMAAGSVDHGSGTRDVRELSGLWGKMKVTGVIIALASLSMAGLPPFFGFIGKEVMYEGMLEAGSFGIIVTISMILANATMLGAAGLVFWKPFMGRPSPAADHAHESGIALLLGPAALAGLGLLFGLFSGIPGANLLGAVTTAVTGIDTVLDLHLWHGITPALGLSVITVALGVVLFLALGRVKSALDGLARVSRINVDAAWDHILAGLDAVFTVVTRRMQPGYLRTYMFLTFLSITVLLGGTILLKGGLPIGIGSIEASYLGWFLAALMVIGTIGAVAATSRLQAITALSVVGLAIALLFLVYGAPDVGITQLMVETLTVIIIVLVLARLPPFKKREQLSNWVRLRNGAVSIALGAIVTSILLAVSAIEQPLDLSEFFAARSYVDAHGRNVVNVILVDFRGFDTLGEITVVAVAGLGVFALLKARLSRKVQGGAD